MLVFRPDERVAKRQARAVIRRLQHQTKALQRYSLNMQRWLDKGQLIEMDSMIKPRLKTIEKQLEELNFLIDTVRFGRKAQP